MQTRPARHNIVPATQGLIDGMKGRIRAVDVYEAEAIFGFDADDGLQYSFEHSSKCWVVLVDGLAVCAFGVVPGDNGVGIPWLVGTDGIRELSRAIVRESRTFLMLILADFSRLENYIWRENSVAIKWLKWLGFQFETLSDPARIDMRFWYERDH